MASYTAADVKKLREETGAPMMECKSALEEAESDFARAKEILREKGQAAAAKRSDRTTGAGVVAFASNGDAVSGVVLECETDFVALNEDFIALAQQAAEAGLVDDSQFASIAENATAKFRELTKVARYVKLPANTVTYVHHDRTKGAAVVASEKSDALKKVAIQVVAFPPQVVAKEELSQELLAKEIELETKRAIDEGKPENIARNIAQGRVNKEFIKQVVLLEQPFYADPSKSVAVYLSEEAKGVTVTQFEYLAIGQGS
ncbi:translation elongation factor Ts [bacterium]|nr:MAG: translation elongation factor Ts [bacterium]